MTTNTKNRLFQATAEDFKKIPGSPIAYWISLKQLEGNRFFSHKYISGGRNKTHNNEKYIRFFWEVPAEHRYWIPYANGGAFRKYFGNEDIVVNWSENAQKNYDLHGGLCNKIFWGKEGICWSLITSGVCSFRIKSSYAQYSSGAPTIFNNTGALNYADLAFFNSAVTKYFLTALNPTINTTVSDVLTLPLKSIKSVQSVEYNSCQCITAAEKDWNSYETSWDFQSNPLIETARKGQTQGSILQAYMQTRQVWQQQCEEMRRLEVENNRIFIEAYGLQEELSPEVPWNEITLTCNPWYRYGKSPKIEDDGRVVVDSEECHTGDVWGISDKGIVFVVNAPKLSAETFPCNQELENRLLLDTIKELLSYAVGCMFGRYSLDAPGLAYAGGDWDASKYTAFPADDDNIIPICDDDYFEDDLMGRFVNFIKVVFGAETLEANLNFIACVLGGRGSAREVIRNYFRNDFFADHCKTYQKRPIYWLFDSGKKGGFRALIYMHRYQPDTLARMRTDYVHEQQSRYRTAVASLEQRVDNAAGSEKVKLSKQLTALRDQAEETRLYEEKIHHLADQMISIDLDDGVKHNYAIFQDVLAKIK